MLRKIDRVHSRARASAATHSSPARVADRLHSAAIQLLRRLKREDASVALTGPRASALSVVVFTGPISLSQLAAAEQVKPPTMTRLVTALERQRLVVRRASQDDARVVLLHATPKGIALLQAGRARRLTALQAALQDLAPKELATLAEGTGVLERVLQSLAR